MTSITLNNTAAGGTVNITLNFVIGNNPVGVNRFAMKRIPGKTSPTIDTDTFTMDPTRYRIRALITNAEKATLITLRNQLNRQCKFSDAEVSNKNVRPINVGFAINPGSIQYPWVATIILEAEDH